MSTSWRTPCWVSRPTTWHAWSSTPAKALCSRSTRKSRWCRACRANSTNKEESLDVLAPSRLCVHGDVRLRARRVYAATLRVQHIARGDRPDPRAGHQQSSGGGARDPRYAGPALTRLPVDGLVWTDRDPRHWIRLLAQPAGDQLACRRLGCRAAAAVRDLRAPRSRRAEDFQCPRGGGHKDPELLVRRLGICLRRDRQAALEHRRRVRVSDHASDHLRLRAVRHYVLPRHHADRREGVRGGNEQNHGCEWRREPQRRGIDLHGTDRGAAHDPPLLAAHDALRIDDRDDGGHGACFGIDYGGLHCIRETCAMRAV